MIDSLQNLPAIFYPLLFVAIWLGVAALLGLKSGWYTLASRYPDQLDDAMLTLRFQSGAMGGVPRASFNGLLRLSACPLGLRVGILRPFGPFSRDFFVPWQEIAVERSTVLFWPKAELRFGNPVVGSLRLSGRAADQLARAAAGRWPEKAALPA